MYMSKPAPFPYAFKIISLAALGMIATFFLGMWSQSALHPPTIEYVPISESQQAQGALIKFLGSLYEKDYAQAASAFGGDYTQLRYWNPRINPTDTTSLWKNGCEVNGLNCLEIRNDVFAS